MPLHPTLVHYPIAFTCIAACFQLLAVVLGRRELTLSALIALGLGALMAIVAAITGAAQEQLLENLPGIRNALDRHADLGNAAAWLLGVASLSVLYLHLKGRLHPQLFLGMLLLATALVLVTGHFGGELVFLHGAGVRH